MEKILLSIIVPVYNVEKYIHKCLDSILPQLTDETELIIVDDCTPDRAGELAQERLAGLEANVMYYRRQQNGGLSAARNSGLEFVKGEYCWFVDSDDTVSSDAVETILSALKEHETDMLIFNHQRVTEDGEIVSRSYLQDGYFSIDTPKDRLAQMCAFLKNVEMGFCVWRRVYSVDIIRQNGLCFEPNKEVFAEDICFNLYYLNYCRRVRTVENSLYDYLLRGDSIMGSNQERPRLQQMHNLAKKVYEHTPFALVRENFCLVYAAIMGIHYGLTKWQDLVDHAANMEKDDFALAMSSATVKSLSKHMAYHGKRNSVYQYVYAQTLKKLLQGRKTAAKVWFGLMRLMKKWNV